MESGYLAGLLFAFFFGFVPIFLFAALVYWTDRYEKEPKFLLVSVFIWGALVAAGAAFMINTALGLGVYFFTGSESTAELTTGSLIAPVVEELLKGFTVLVVFLVFRHEFDSILDGIVYAAIAALGFAATENTYYIFTYGFQENGFAGALFLTFVRVILVGWQHPFYTAFIGIGFALSRLNRDLFAKLLFPLIGLAAAIFAHSVHNTLSHFLSGFGGLAVTALNDWAGWLIMLGFVFWALYREQRWIISQLREEVTLGVITPAQYRVACSAWAQSSARFGALFSGRFAATNRFYQATAELAYKKQQTAMFGDEGGNHLIIQRLRAELQKLSSIAAT
jgi:RsiW-degrading membrane proteinase PrsW (M82 family)